MTEVGVEWSTFRFTFGLISPGVWKADDSMVEAVPTQVMLSFVGEDGVKQSRSVIVPDHISGNLGGNVLDFAIRPDQEVVVSMRALDHKR